MSASAAEHSSGFTSNVTPTLRSLPLQVLTEALSDPCADIFRLPMFFGFDAKRLRGAREREAGACVCR